MEETHCPISIARLPRQPHSGSDTAKRRDHYQQQPHALRNLSSHSRNAFCVGVDRLVERLDERSGYVGRCFLRRLGGVF